MAARPVRRSAAARPRKGAASRRPAKRPGLLAQLLSALPFTDAQVRRAMTMGMVGLFLGGAGVAASYSGVPAFAHERYARAASAAGFEVKRVEVNGLDRMDKLKVYDIVLAEKDRAMPLVDVARIRRDLLAYGWIGDARVSRRLPDTLVVDIVERRPAAVWSHGGKLSLIDPEGRVLEHVAAGKRPGLPMLIGRDANIHSRDLADLLDAAPALKPRIVAASWIGNRRWDLEFDSGETLALPEGPDIAAEALTNFARMDGVAGLLGKQTTRFDMRDPTRAYFRRAEPPKPAPSGEEES